MKHSRQTAKPRALSVACMLMLAAVADLAQAATGKEIYQSQCSACHGESGAGDGPAAQKLPKPPLALKLKTSQQIEKSVLVGPADALGHGVAPQLTPAEATALMDYVKHLAK